MTVITWDCFDLAVQKILHFIKTEKKQYKSIYGIPRGGIPLAIRLSHELDLPLLMGGVDSNTLVVDDIADSGFALTPFIERSKCDTITICRKNWCPVKPTYWVYDTESWVHFPWEKQNAS